MLVYTLTITLLIEFSTENKACSACLHTYHNFGHGIQYRTEPVVLIYTLTITLVIEYNTENRACSACLHTYHNFSHRVQYRE